GPFGWDKRPVTLVVGPGGDPAPQRLLFLTRQLLLRLRGRHDLVGVCRGDAGEELALVRLARHDGPPGDGNVTNVDTEPGLAGRTVRAMASEAVLGQDRANVTAITGRVGGGGGSCQHQDREGGRLEGAVCHGPSPARTL